MTTIDKKKELVKEINKEVNAMKKDVSRRHDIVGNDPATLKREQPDHVPGVVQFKKAKRLDNKRHENIPW